MKTSLFRKACAALVLAIGPMIGGCTGQDSNAATPTAAVTNAGPPTSAVAGTTTSTTAQAEAGVVAGAPPTTAPEVPFAVERPLPSNVQPGTPLAEVVKLAQAGVDEEVILTFVSNSGSAFGVGADEILYLNDLGMPKPVITAMMERDKVLKATWTAAQPAPVVTSVPTQSNAAVAMVETPAPEPAAAVADVDYDQSLAPYGTWIEVEDYGRCWQPSVVVINHDWRPYCDRGRWLYTDGGWYWLSDYSWGSVTFHYGRWFNHARWGWCWQPDNIWAPAWVTWRYDNAYCGWAPLPPRTSCAAGVGFTYCGSSVGVNFSFGLNAGCYTFVPWGRFCNYRPREHCLPSTQVAKVYHNTTVINNIVVGNNNTVINRGIAPQHVSAFAHTEVRTYALREGRANGAMNNNLRNDRVAEDGRSLIVHRPRVHAATVSGLVNDRRFENHGAGRTVTGTTPTTSSPHQLGAPNSIPSQILGHADSERANSRRRDSGSSARVAEVNVSTHTLNPSSQVVAETPSSAPHTSTPSQPAQPAQRVPQRDGSLVVIGQGQGRATPSHSGSYSVYNNSPRTETREHPAQIETPHHTAPVVSAPSETPAQSSHSYSTPAPAAPSRPDFVRVSRGIEDRPAGRPTYSVATPVAPAPSYSQPSAPVYSQPAAPSHVAPREDVASSRGSYQAPPAPSAPHYSPPPAQPAPTRSEPAQAPSRSSESRSSSSRSDSDKKGQPR